MGGGGGGRAAEVEGILYYRQAENKRGGQGIHSCTEREVHNKTSSSRRTQGSKNLVHFKCADIISRLL